MSHSQRECGRCTNQRQEGKQHCSPPPRLYHPWSAALRNQGLSPGLRLASFSIFPMFPMPTHPDGRQVFFKSNSFHNLSSSCLSSWQLFSFSSLRLAACMGRIGSALRSFLPRCAEFLFANKVISVGYVVAVQISSSRLGTNILFTWCQRHSVMERFDIISSVTSMNYSTSLDLSIALPNEEGNSVCFFWQTLE